jgi:hypothetical protein
LIQMLKLDVKISSLFNVKGKIGMFGMLDSHDINVENPSYLVF